LDAVVAAGIHVADLAGNLDFSLRTVSDRLGVGVMTLYSYTDSKDQLLELMIDQCRATMAFTAPDGPWRARLTQVAADNLALMRAHPWLAHVESERAILGPGTLAKYERELAAVEPLGLDDAAKDAALTLVLDFVRASARAKAAAIAERSLETPEEWWQREGAQLAALGIEDRFPLAQRIGSAAGAATNAAHDADNSYRFGLKVILDGIGNQ
ncbi:MAG: TetR/AcrR family transcriptional regulator C-terminal domain-containing protein, partial [Propionibacteriaceae bacterium]|nr:TetR/AcrR family transcriptional regulator C-terminal domain-containing protein [Propionibacteriaceae bacterium]